MRDFWPVEKIETGVGGMGASRWGGFEKIARGMCVSKYAYPGTTSADMSYERLDTITPNYPGGYTI